MVQEGLEAALQGLQPMLELAGLVEERVEGLCERLEDSAGLAGRVSARVRELDRAQGRVRGTLMRLDALTERASALEGVKAALASEDFEEATRLVRVFREIEAGGVAGAEDDKAGSMAIEVRQLEERVRIKMREAEESGDSDQLLRFAALWGPLGKPDEGRTALAAVATRRSTKAAEEAWDGLLAQVAAHEERGGAKPPDFCTVFAIILRSSAAAAAAAGDAAGEGAVAAMTTAAYAASEARAAGILQRFGEHRALVRLAQDVSGPRVGPDGGPARQLPDPRALEGTLQELLLMIARGEEYLGWVEGRLKGATEGGDADQGSVDLLGGLRSKPLNTALGELQGFYCLLERCYLERSIAKAAAMDKLTTEGLTSSLVDDAFYLLLKCARRAAASRSPQCLCNVLSNINQILVSDVKAAVQRRLRGSVQRLLSGLSAEDAEQEAGPGRAGAEGGDRGRTGQRGVQEAAAALNNLDVCSDYIQKLRRELERTTQGTPYAASDKDRIRSCLGDLGKTAGDYRALSSSALEAVARGIVPRLRSNLDILTGISYELSETDYSAYEAEDPWAQRVLAGLEECSALLQPLLTQANYDSVVHLIIDAIVGRIEAMLMQKRFNQLGALQLDKEVRGLVSQTSSLTERTVRDKFARLSHVSTALNLDSPAEILDYWGDNAGTMNWRLTGREVKQVLRLRRDFAPDDIELLAL